MDLNEAISTLVYTCFQGSLSEILGVKLFQSLHGWD